MMLTQEGLPLESAPVTIEHPGRKYVGALTTGVLVIGIAAITFGWAALLLGCAMKLVALALEQDTAFWIEILTAFVTCTAIGRPICSMVLGTRRARCLKSTTSEPRPTA